MLELLGLAALWWTTIVVATTLPLVPAVALGWQRRWFRSAPW